MDPYVIRILYLFICRKTVRRENYPKETLEKRKCVIIVAKHRVVTDTSSCIYLSITLFENGEKNKASMLGETDVKTDNVAFN